MTEFFRPESIAQALSLLEQYRQDAAVVNGGSDIVIDLTKQRIRPAAIISIGQIAQLQQICLQDDYLCIGGAVTYKQMLSNADCCAFRGLVQAVSQVGSPAIRAVGTPAGNLVTAAPAADCAAMLLALGADAVLQSTAGTRTVPLTEFYYSRGKTERRPDELLTEIRIPALAPGEGTGYFRVARRKAQDIGKVLAGCRITLADGTVCQARFSLGAVNACPVRAESLEQAILGKSAEEAVEICRRTFPAEAGLRESYFKEYKEAVVPAVAAKAVALALEDAAERSGR